MGQPVQPVQFMPKEKKILRSITTTAAHSFGDNQHKEK